MQRGDFHRQTVFGGQLKVLNLIDNVSKNYRYRSFSDWLLLLIPCWVNLSAEFVGDYFQAFCFVLVNLLFFRSKPTF
jgi:hypothetical protein